MELNYFAKYSFALSLDDFQGGKETILTAFSTKMKEQERKYNLMALKYNKCEMDDDAIIIKYTRMPFANLLINEEILIKDQTICYYYEEKNSDKLLLPNIYSYITMLMLFVKIVQELIQDFDKQKVECKVDISHNGSTYYYDKYSPLKTDFSLIHKYSIKSENIFDYQLKNKDGIYALINKIYQRYYTEQSIDKRFVTVDKEDFLKKYDEL